MLQETYFLFLPSHALVLILLIFIFLRICLCTPLHYFTFKLLDSNFIIIIEFFTSQLQLGNIRLSWDIIINRNRLDGLIYNFKSFLQLNMFQELQIFAFVCTYLDAG